MSTVLDWLDEPSATRGISFAAPDGTWSTRSYGELAGDAGRVAALLRDAGAAPGGVASVLVAEPQAFVAAFLGAMLAGLTPSPIAAPLGFHDAERWIEHAALVVRAAGPAVVLTDAPLLSAVSTVAERAGAPSPLVVDVTSDRAPDLRRTAAPEVALLQFTSGSTGNPKGIRVTGDNLFANVRSIHRWLGITAADSCASWLPLYHDMGLVGTFLGSVVAQIDLHLMTPLAFLHSPLRWLECMGTRGATVTTAPNFGYGYVLRRVPGEQLSGLDFTGWRTAMTGAERVDPRVAADFARLLAPAGFRPEAFAPCYGLAEATLGVSGVRPGVPARTVRLAGALRAGEPVEIGAVGVLGVDRPEDGGTWLTSCGPAMPGVEVDVVDDEGQPLPERHLGELRVRGGSVALGYRAAPGPDGVFGLDGLRTGDAGFMLGGEVVVVGRIGDSLKIRGRQVHAEDVEGALLAVPGIGSGRVAVALGTEGATDHVVVLVESTGTDWLDGALSVLRSATGEDVRITVSRGGRGDIPRTSSGKPRRRLLWQLRQDGRLPGELVAGPPAPVLATP